MPYTKPDIIYPIEIWCACPSYDVQKETTQKKLETYLPKNRIKKIIYVKTGVWGEVILDNGVRINFKSYEQGREKFQGAGKRIIWFDEEPPHDIWEEAFVRVEAGVPLDIILTMTPINGMTWVYDDLYMQNGINPDLFVSEAEWDDNPFLTEAQKKQMMQGLRPDAIEVRRKGQFMQKTGLVCRWWRGDKHLQDIVFNPDWQVGGALDFGYSNPACFGLIGVDYDDNLNLFSGFYEKGLTSPKIAERIVKLCQAHGVNMNDLVIVADSAQAQSIQELNDISTTNKYGFVVIGVVKQPKTSQQNWDEWRADKLEQYGEVVNDKTKLLVSKDLLWFDEKQGKTVNWFASEANSLKWAEVASAIGKEKVQGSTWDIRYANHAIDMITYFISYHIEAPERPKNDPLANKIPNTYIRPSPVKDEESESGDWAEVSFSEEVL